VGAGGGYLYDQSQRQRTEGGYDRGYPRAYRRY